MGEAKRDTAEEAAEQICPAMVPVDILGLGCRFPESANASQFWQNLRDGQDMVTSNDSRWPVELHGTPARFGKVPDFERFDASFFPVHGKQAQKMDPQMRKLLEVSWEAWVDSGVDMNKLRGSSRVGVYIGCCGSEVHAAWLSDIPSITGYEQTGCTQSMFANRLSWTYDFRGPSKAVDTACSSSALALHDAIADISAGRCDYAMVGGASSILRPATSVAFNKLRMLSPDGTCKSFSAAANGYTRADGIAILILRRADLQSSPKWCVREPYAQIVNIGTNNDGHTEKGITFPSADAQGQLARQVCRAAGVEPRQIGYVEAHGTGTVAGDGQELGAIDEWYGRAAGRCSEDPLLIGSVKSNMGHCEGASGLAGVVKLCLAYEHGSLPGNLHYDKPNPECASLHDGTLKVVDQTRPWTGGFAALSSFGFGGSNVHLLMHRQANPNRVPRVISLRAEDASLTQDQGQQTDIGQLSENGLSGELIPLAARTSQGIEVLKDALKCSGAGRQQMQHPLRRWANTVGADASKFPWRGVLQNEEIRACQVAASQPQVWYVFSGNGSQWPQMGASLLQSNPTYRASLLASCEVAKQLGVDLHAEFTSSQGFQDPSRSALGLCAVQIALVDVLAKDYGITPEGMLGHSAGEIACGYASGCLSQKQTLEVAFYRGRLPVIHGLKGGLMVATGLSAADACKRLEGSSCVVACDNSSESTTLSGPAEELRRIAASLKEKGVFVRELDTLGLAYHSPALDPLLPDLIQELHRVIPNPAERPATWISTSFEADSPSSEAASCSAEYQVHSYRNRVLFTSAVAAIPDGALLVEIGPHSVLRTPLRQSRPELGYVSLMQKGTCGVSSLSKAVGDLWLKGAKLQWPAESVPSGIKGAELPWPVRQALTSWDHTIEYPMPKMTGGSGLGFSKTYELGGAHSFLADHKIDSRILMPATSYLVTAWEALASQAGKQMADFPVTWSDVSIYQAVQAEAQDNVTLSVLLDRSDRFQVLNGTDLIAEGKIKARPVQNKDKPVSDSPDDEAKEPLTWAYNEAETVDADAFYRDVARTGITYGPCFCMVQKASTDGSQALMRWDNCFIRFLDGMLQSSALGSTDYQLRIPVRLRQVDILNAAPALECSSSVLVDVDATLGSAKTEFCAIAGVELSTAPKRPANCRPKLTRMAWVPYGERTVQRPQRASYLFKLASQMRHLLISELEHMENRTPQLDKVVIALRQLAQTCEGPPEDIAPGVKGSELLDVLQEAAESDPESVLLAVRSKLSDVGSLGAAFLSDNLLGGLGAIELKVLLDIALENQRPEGFTACEIGAACGSFTRQVLADLNCSSATDLIRYTATDLQPVASELQSSKLASEVWDIQTPAPPSLHGNVNFILGSHALRQVQDTRKTLQGLHSALAEGGFLLLHELTGPISACLWGLQEAASDSLGWTAQQWQEALSTAGFVEVSTLRCATGASAIFLYRKVVASALSAVVLEGPPLPAADGTIDTFLTGYHNAGEQAVAPKEGDQSEAANGRIWVHGDEQASLGLLGFALSARKEPKGELLRCVFNTGDAASPASSLIESCQRMDLFHNMFVNGRNGSYRTIEVDLAAEVSESGAECHLEFTSYGDLSSWTWVANTPLPASLAKELVTVKVAFGSLNFRDVMLAWGKLSRDAMAHSRGGDYIGLEFSGRVAGSGLRVMGVAQKAIATQVSTNPYLVWDVPEGWSLADAASVPVAYATAYYSLVVRGRLRRGFSVLIHSGSGAVGLAAIQICLNRGCQVFTTCGSAAKRDFLLARFPGLQAENIGDSRSCSFEALVMKATAGRGVQLILNSLADDKLQASVRCLSNRGRLLEIGKYDILRGTPLSMRPMLRNIAFDGIDLDRVFNDADDTTEIEALHCLMQEGLLSGEVRPLPATVFSHARAEEAFRFMAKGVHIGKCMIDMGTEGDRPSESCPVPGGETAEACSSSNALCSRPPVARALTFTCREDRSYVITGGLGGFGLALAQWLSQQGAKALLLTSKRGLRNGAQSKIIQQIEKQGTQVIVSTLDVADPRQTKQLLARAGELAPVGGIFHLAMVMADKWIANQTGEGWNKGVLPKAIGACNLDAASRSLNSLEHFVMFSSIVASAGNEGQSNYGYANCALDFLCEARLAQGLPALSIQWGVIGHVGFVEEAMQGKMIGRLAEISLPQPVDDCLKVLGTMLCSGGRHGAVMGSFWQPSNLLGTSADESDKDLLTAILDIMGLDAGSVSDSNSLASMGIDSMQLVEVRACIQRALGRPLPLEEIGTLTVGGLKALAGAAGPSPPKAAAAPPSGKPTSTRQMSNESAGPASNPASCDVSSQQPSTSAPAATPATAKATASPAPGANGQSHGMPAKLKVVNEKKAAQEAFAISASCCTPSTATQQESFSSVASHDWTWMCWSAYTGFGVLLLGVLLFSAAQPFFQQTLTLASALPLPLVLVALPLLWLLLGSLLCFGTILLKKLVMPALSVEHPIQLWSLDFARWWLVHRAIALTNRLFACHLQGTCLLPAYIRAMGARTGQSCFIDSLDFMDLDLIEIGDNVAVGEGATIVAHIFEEKSLKFNKVIIKSGTVIEPFEVVTSSAKTNAASPTPEPKKDRKQLASLELTGHAYTSLQVCGMYLNALLVVLGASAGYAVLAVVMLSLSPESSSAFQAAGFATAGLLVLTSPFLLAFVPLLVQAGGIDLTWNQSLMLVCVLPLALAVSSYTTALACACIKRLAVGSVIAGVHRRQSLLGLKCWLSQQLVRTAYCHAGSMLTGSWAMNTFYRHFGAEVGKWATFRVGNVITLPEQLQVGEWAHIGDTANVVTSAAVDSQHLNVGPVVIKSQALLGVQATVLPEVTVGEGATLGALSRAVAGSTLAAGMIHMGCPAAPFMRAAPKSSDGETPVTVWLQAYVAILPILQLLGSWTLIVASLSPAATAAHLLALDQLSTAATLGSATLVTATAASGLALLGAFLKRTVLGKLEPASGIHKYSGQNLTRMLFWTLDTKADDTWGQAFRGSPWWNCALKARGVALGQRAYIDTLWAGDYELVSYGEGAIVDHGTTIFAHLGMYKAGELSMTQQAVTLGEGAMVGPRAAVLPGFSLAQDGVLAAGKLGMPMKL